MMEAEGGRCRARVIVLLLDFRAYFCSSLFLMKNFKSLDETPFFGTLRSLPNSQGVRSRKTGMIGYGGLSALRCEPHWGF